MNRKRLEDEKNKINPDIYDGAPNTFPNRSGYNFEPTENYMQKSIDDAKAGNLAGAMYNERMHNIKDGRMNLGYGASGIWNYQDNSGLGGLKERKYNEIEDYFSTPFSYDYRDDSSYKAMRRLKEKEAKKAYDDGYAALSTQFEGGVPVNMMNKLHETSNDIIDSADSYIPTLRQLAHDMYLGKGNQLLNQYGMLSDMENQQYGRFLTDRDFMERGANTAWNRNYTLGRDAIGDARYNTEWDYGLSRDAIGDARYEDEKVYNRGRDAIGDARYNAEWDRGILESDRDYELRKHNAYK